MRALLRFLRWHPGWGFPLGRVHPAAWWTRFEIDLAVEKAKLWGRVLS